MIMWLAAAALSAVFAALSSVLAKCGIKKTDSDAATAIRTSVVLVFAWIMAFIVGSVEDIADIGARSLVFLLLSGATTGASWICYFKALSLGDVNKVAPIDKSSAALTVLLAVICFGETDALAVKLAGTVLLFAGTLLTVEKKKASGAGAGNAYIPFAVGSALFAALTSVLAKIGINDVESNLGTAIRTVVVLLMAWAIVLAKGKGGTLRSIDRREAAFIVLSGIATGASWLCYYYAIRNGQVSVVVPIDKLSLPVTVALSYFILGERVGKRAFAGICLMVAGTLAVAIFAS